LPFPALYTRGVELPPWPTGFGLEVATLGPLATQLSGLFGKVEPTVVGRIVPAGAHEICGTPAIVDAWAVVDARRGLVHVHNRIVI
jgi:hypothetical protein